MSKKTKSPIFLTIPRMTSIVLSIVMVALQFLPFWTIDGKKLSISDLLWFIYKHPEFKAYFQKIDPSITINSAIIVPLFVFIAAVATFITCFIVAEKTYAIAPIACFIITVGGYLIKPELRAGNLWFLHLIPATIIGVLTILDIFNVFSKKAKK